MRKKKIKELSIVNANLESVLDLSNFSELCEIDISGSPHLGEIKNKRWYTDITVNAQEWLSKKYHNKQEVEKRVNCWQCAESKKIRVEIKEQNKQIYRDKESKNTNKEQCSECKKWVKKLDEDSGVCKNCQEKYG